MKSTMLGGVITLTLLVAKWTIIPEMSWLIVAAIPIICVAVIVYICVVVITVMTIRYVQGRDD